MPDPREPQSWGLWWLTGGHFGDKPPATPEEDDEAELVDTISDGGEPTTQRLLGLDPPPKKRTHLSLTAFKREIKKLKGE